MEPALVNWEGWTVLLLVALTALSFLLFNQLLRQSKARLPPGPSGVPVFGNLGILASTHLPHQELHRLAQKYGPIMSLRLGSKQAIVVSSPEVAKEVLKDRDQVFSYRPYASVVDIMGFGNHSMTFVSYGPHWRFLKKLATLELLTIKRVEQFQYVRVEEVGHLVKCILEDGTGGVDLKQTSSYLIMNLMSRILMSKRICFYTESDARTSSPSQQNQASETKALVDEIFFLSTAPLIRDFIPWLGFLDNLTTNKARMRKVQKQLNSFMDAVLKERESYNGQDSLDRDFISLLLSVPGEDGATNLDPQVMKALFMEMFSAGTETTSTTLEWTFAELLRNPSKLQQVQSELNAVVGKDRLVLESDLPDLRYLQAVVKETLRLHPPVPLLVPHMSGRACEVRGYHIPANTTTLVNAWSIGRTKGVWERPLEFLPERFLDQAAAADIDFRGQHFQLLPFGSGRRSCPGMHLALAQVHYSLARLLQAFHWSLPEGQAPQDLDMSERFGLSLPRAKPLWAVPTSRLPAHILH